jgi:hypothetical protein
VYRAELLMRLLKEKPRFQTCAVIKYLMLKPFAPESSRMAYYPARGLNSLKHAGVVQW